jgi:phage anti-repressor protein
MPNNPKKTKNQLTTIEGINIPAITKIGDQLMLSGQTIFYLCETFVEPFKKWFNKEVIKSRLTLEDDDYVVNPLKRGDYLISIDLAKRMLMASQNEDAYNIMLTLQYVEFHYELGNLHF